MPTNLEQVRKYLDEYDLRYLVDERHDAILIGFSLDPAETTFRDSEGEAAIQLVIRIQEDGEFLQVFGPQAWNIDDCPHRAAVCEALAAIQARFKILRFDYDPNDGEIRPNVELPLEDADLSSAQLHRLVHCVLEGVKRFDGLIRHAMTTGEVSFALVTGRETGGPPPAVARLQQLAAEAGGLDELERLACGRAGETMDEDGAGPPPAAETVAEHAEPPAPKPVIRRIWEQLFGRDGPETGSQRKAG